MFRCVCVGYANEVGEAFRAWIPRTFVHGTYGIATAYVLLDCYDKGKKASLVRNIN